MVPMRDGVRLATDIYRPAKDGEAIAEPFPTLLSRNGHLPEKKEAKLYG